MGKKVLAHKILNSENNLETFKELYYNSTNSEMSQLLGCSISKIVDTAKKMGLDPKGRKGRSGAKKKFNF